MQQNYHVERVAPGILPSKSRRRVSCRETRRVWLIDRARFVRRQRFRTCVLEDNLPSCWNEFRYRIQSLDIRIGPKDIDLAEIEVFLRKVWRIRYFPSLPLIDTWVLIVLILRAFILSCFCFFFMNSGLTRRRKLSKSMTDHIFWNS